jgi:hypothetical protein
MPAQRRPVVASSLSAPYTPDHRVAVPAMLRGLGDYPPVSTFSRNLIRLTMGWRRVFRPPHVANNSQRQKGGGEQGERWRKRDGGNRETFG